MDLELLVKLSARIRQLSDEQFAALQQLVETADEQTEHLPAVAQALSDCIDLTNEHNERNRVVRFAQPRMRLVP
jgi:hypothetical protein